MNQQTTSKRLNWTSCRGPSHRAGSIIPLVAFSLVILIVAAAFSVDTAYIQLSRTEMRSAVDASARAAGQVLSAGGTDVAARQAAKDVALLNKVAGRSLELQDTDIVQGNARRGTTGVYSFTAGGYPSNAFQITGRRTNGSIGGRINTIFGGMLGVSKFDQLQTATVVRGDRDVMLVLDKSGSMMFRLDVDLTYPLGRSELTPSDPLLSRWGVLCSSLNVFFSTLNTTTPIEKVGLVTFDTLVQFRSPVTTDYTALTTLINDVSSQPLIGWTNLGEGMQVARQQLLTSPQSSLHAARTIVLLTDGQPNLGPDPYAEALLCRDAKITVHTISYSAFANTTLMQSIADVTGGSYYAAPTAATLQTAFQKIGRDLPVLLTQ